jgi:hypothetical protein
VEQYKCSNRSQYFSNWRSHPQRVEELPLQVEAEPRVEELLEAEVVLLVAVEVLLEVEVYPLNNQRKLKHNHRPLMVH